MIEKINQDFFLTDAVTLAKKLLGKILVRTIDGQVIKARIVETEAYMGTTDKASHSYKFGKIKKVLPMYQNGGTIYVYLIYGMYYCFNISASKKDDPQSVFIRAVEIIEGQEIAKNYVTINNRNKNLKHWTNGPGKLSLALNINKSLNNLHLLNNDLLTLVNDNFNIDDNDIIAAKRININYAEEDKELFWRFYLKDSEFVSKDSLLV